MDGAARLEGGVQGGQVGGAALGFGQEVEDGPVVPEAVAAVRLPGEQVGVDPADAARRRAPGQPLAGGLQRCRGDVDGGEVSESGYGQLPGQ